MIVKCSCCNKEFNKQKCEVIKSKNNYCSRSCAAKINNRLFKKRNKKVRHCRNCKIEIIGKGKLYCSIKCQNVFQSEIKIKSWQLGMDDGYETNGTVRRYIKKFLLEKRGQKCEECGWNKINPNTNKCPLEIHHRDGNYKNNIEENLQILCPNCHSLTDTYKNMNKGNGRECRR
jgi:hypothetical protein